MAPKMSNKDGSLTDYAFACGYVMEKGSARLAMRDGVFFLYCGGDKREVRTFRRREMTKAKRALREVKA